MRAMMTIEQQKELARQLEYSVLASEMGRRNQARAMELGRIGRKRVLWRCACGWTGGAREARAHRCPGKKLEKMNRRA